MAERHKRMVSPSPALARAHLVNMLTPGDQILMPLQVNGSARADYHRGTVVQIDDDEANRLLRVTLNFASLKTTTTIPMKPGNLVHRCLDGTAPETHSYVRAPDLWKWEGALIDDPNGAEKVRIIRAVRGPHPEDHHEILALVVQQTDGTRKPLFLELSGGMFCEWETP